MGLISIVNNTATILAATTPEACFERPDVDTKADLFQGAAGVAFFFHEVARLQRDRQALLRADKWCSYAERVQHDPLPPNYSSRPNHSRSVFGGQAGVAYARTLISTLSDNESLGRRAADAFCQAWDGTVGMGERMPLEVISGAAGFACAAHDLLCRCRLPVAVAEGLRHVEKQALTRIVERLEQPLRDRKGTCAYFAHGVAGELFACLLAGGPQDLFEERLREFIHFAVDERPLILWPFNIGETEFGWLPGSWCNGLPGILILLTRAARVLRSNDYLQVAQRVAFTTFRLWNSAQPPTLCCGTAGQALALSAYADLASDERFRRRARERMRQAAAAATSTQLHIERLWQGTLGIALAALVTASGENFFPILEPPRAAMQGRG